MIAEEQNIDENTESIPTTVEQGTTISKILELILDTAPVFQTYIKTHLEGVSLNEDKYSQVFIEQAEILIRLKNLYFGIKGQLRDIYNDGKGIPDIYFHTIEQGKRVDYLFTIEAKRLPTKGHNREREYVIDDRIKDGKKLNGGGIERFKNGTHGKFQSECAMLGYIEENEFIYWHKHINTWIVDLASTNEDWSTEETLKQSTTVPGKYAHLKSIVARKLEGKLELHHFWIKIS